MVRSLGREVLFRLLQLVAPEAEAASVVVEVHVAGGAPVARRVQTHSKQDEWLRSWSSIMWISTC